MGTLSYAPDRAARTAAIVCFGMTESRSAAAVYESERPCPAAGTELRTKDRLRH